MSFALCLTMFSALLAALEAETSTTESVSSTWTNKNKKTTNPMFQYSKNDEYPTFNVIAKTRTYTDSLRIGGSLDESLYDKDYVLRGGPPTVVGPIDKYRQDLSSVAQKNDGLGIRDTYPNVEINTFGHTIDRENPYRCFYFQRWHKVQHDDGNPLNMVDDVSIVATIVWTPEGKIIYEQIGTIVVDHLEATTTAVVVYNNHIPTAKRSSRRKILLLTFIQRLKNLLATDGGDNKGFRRWLPKKVAA